MLSGVKAIAAGGAHTCALIDRGRRPLLGRQRSRASSATGRRTTAPTPPAADVVGGVAAVSAGDTHTCALTNAGGVRCWGHNGDGELGHRHTTTPSLSPPTTDVLSGVKQVVAGNLFTCALLTSGGVRCWGYNSHGEIGDDTPNRGRSPEPGDRRTFSTARRASRPAVAHVCARMTERRRPLLGRQ